MSSTMMDLVDSDGLERLEQAADGLSPDGIGGALVAAGVDSSQGLAGVPKAKADLVEGCLVAMPRADARPSSSPHLAPADPAQRARLDKLNEARNHGHRAYQNALAEFNREEQKAFEERLGRGPSGQPLNAQFDALRAHG